MYTNIFGYFLSLAFNGKQYRIDLFLLFLDFGPLYVPP